MMDIKIPKETCEMLTKVLTYINHLENGYRKLNDLNDGKDHRQDLEWLEAKVSAAREMFDIMICNSECVLEYDDLHERWTIRLDLGNKLLANEEDS